MVRRVLIIVTFILLGYIVVNFYLGAEMCKIIVSNDSYRNIKLSFWNLHGYKSRLIGNKLKDTDFLQEIQDSHVIGLAETHIHDEIMDQLIIPGYKLFSYKNGKKNVKSNTAPGGLWVHFFISRGTSVS